MSHDRGAMDNPINWSFRVGRLWGINIRIHLFFIVGAVYLLAPSLGTPEDGQAGIGLARRAGMLITLFAIVLLHEFGHCWGARRSGGEADEILLWPLGGLASVRPADTPRAHMITIVAGPAVNLFFVLLTSAIMVVAFGGLGAVPWNPFDPFIPVNGSPQFFLNAIYWHLCVFFTINYVLLLFNLLPIFPMDGGQMLRAYLWPRKGQRSATLTATWIGMVGSIALGLVGLVTGEMLLIMLAVFTYLTAYYERRTAKTEMDEVLGEFGYDFSQGYVSLNRETQKVKEPGYFERRRIRREQEKQERERQRREHLAQRVDEILQKIARTGMDSLSSEEQRILREETERQRSSPDS